MKKIQKTAILEYNYTLRQIQNTQNYTQVVDLQFILQIHILSNNHNFWNESK